MVTGRGADSPRGQTGACAYQSFQACLSYAKFTPSGTRDTRAVNTWRFWQLLFDNLHTAAGLQSSAPCGD